jgi:hypothetical protein
MRGAGHSHRNRQNQDGGGPSCHDWAMILRYCLDFLLVSGRVEN